MQNIKACIFTVESLAHLQGKEQHLLPMVEAARLELKSLTRAVDTKDKLSLVRKLPEVGDPILNKADKYMLAIIQAQTELWNILDDAGLFINSLHNDWTEQELKDVGL